MVVPVTGKFDFELPLFCKAGDPSAEYKVLFWTVPVSMPLPTNWKPTKPGLTIWLPLMFTPLML